MRINTTFKTLAPLFGALALAACQAEEVEVEPAVEDESGGELITTPADAEGVDVNLPETPMTNVPAEGAEAAPAEGEAAPAE